MIIDTMSEFTQSTDSHAHLRTGTLTQQKLLLWVHENNTEKPWNPSHPVTIDHCDAGVSEATDRLWQEMSEDVDFLEIFLNLSKPAQNWTVYQITNYMPAETLVDSHLLDLTIDSIRNHPETAVKLEQTSGHQDGYSIAEYEFLHYQSRFQNSLKSNWTDFNRVVIGNLKVIYGSRVVVSAVRRWIDCKASRDLSIFIHLVRNWDKWEPFPMDWVISVMDKSSERREGKWSIEELLT